MSRTSSREHLRSSACKQTQPVGKIRLRFLVSTIGGDLIASAGQRPYSIMLRASFRRPLGERHAVYSGKRRFYDVLKKKKEKENLKKLHYTGLLRDTHGTSGAAKYKQWKALKPEISEQMRKIFPTPKLLFPSSSLTPGIPPLPTRAAVPVPNAPPRRSL